LFILGFFSNEKSRSERVRAQILSLSRSLLLLNASYYISGSVVFLLARAFYYALELLKTLLAK